jgi:hypothetical protein
MAFDQFGSNAGRTNESNSGPIVVGSTQLNAVRVAQLEPPGAELSRWGRRFFLAPLSGITGIAPVQTVPTTAAHWVLWNADTVKTYFFETVGVAPASGTAGVGGQCLAALISAPAQTGLATGVAVANASASSTNTSSAACKSSITITTPAAPKWFPIAETVSPNVGAYPGSGLLINRNVAGKIVVPPGYGLALATLALAGTTPLFIPVLEWYEAKSDNE